MDALLVLSIWFVLRLVADRQGSRLPAGWGDRAV